MQTQTMAQDGFLSFLAVMIPFSPILSYQRFRLAWKNRSPSLLWHDRQGGVCFWRHAGYSVARSEVAQVPW